MDRTNLDASDKNIDSISFVSNVEKKFRCFLRKKLTILPKDSILVAYSGSAESTALLHMIKAALHGHVHNSLKFKICVLYIDVDHNNERKVAERQNSIRKYAAQIEELGFTGYMAFLSDSLFDEEPSITTLNPDNVKTGENSNVNEFLNSFVNPTDKKDILLKLRQRLLIYSAQKLNCNKIFMDDSATNVAGIVLSNISLGRGANIPMDLGNIESQFQDVTILRPLKCLSKKELNDYTEFRNIDTLKNSNTELNKYPNATITGITKSFITNLETQGATVTSTICRISEKLKCLDNRLIKACTFCKGILDRQESVMVQMERIKINNKEFNSCEDNLYSKLCYGCNVLFQHYGNTILSISTILSNSNKYFETEVTTTDYHNGDVKKL